MKQLQLYLLSAVLSLVTLTLLVGCKSDEPTSTDVVVPVEQTPIPPLKATPPSEPLVTES